MICSHSRLLRLSTNLPRDRPFALLNGELA